MNQNNDKVNNYLCNHVRDLSNVDCYDPTDNNDDDISYDANISDKNLELMIESSIELDSHANMPVVGDSGYIISDTGDTSDVNAYSPEYESRKIKIVDAALQYESQHDGKISILVLRNALYAPYMKNNLIPPLIMREAGINVNKIPKIHLNNPDVEGHYMFFVETNFRITLSLKGVFSYFPVSKPTVEVLNECEDVYLLTPTTWNPHNNE